MTGDTRFGPLYRVVWCQRFRHEQDAIRNWPSEQSSNPGRNSRFDLFSVCWKMNTVEPWLSNGPSPTIQSSTLKNLNKKWLSDRTNVGSSKTRVEPMKTERGRMTAEANRKRPSLTEQHLWASIQIDPPLNECLILCLCKFLASFGLILYVTAVGVVCNLVISVDCSLNYSHHKYNTKLYNRAKEME